MESDLNTAPTAAGTQVAEAGSDSSDRLIPGRSRLLRVTQQILGIAASAVLLVAVAGFFFLDIGPRVLGYRTMTMLSGSMTPNIRPGDVVIDLPEPLSAVRVGQILTFETPTPSRYVDSHRVIQLLHYKGEVLIRTKGDANTSPDLWTARMNGTVAWQVKAVVPRLGFLITALRSPTPRIVLLRFAPLLLVGFGLAAIWRPKRPAPAKS